MSEITDGIQRRTFLAASGALAGSVALSGSAMAAPARPLAVGDSLGRGWTVSGLESDSAGAVVTTLVASDGGSLRVLMTKAEAGAKAMANTTRVQLMLLNDGAGARPTPDDHVDVVERLARRIEGVEHALPGAQSLLSSSERQRRFRPIDH